MIEVTITFGRPNHVYGKSLVADKAMKLLVLQKGSQRFFTLHFEIEIETPRIYKALIFSSCQLQSPNNLYRFNLTFLQLWWCHHMLKGNFIWSHYPMSKAYIRNQGSYSVKFSAKQPSLELVTWNYSGISDELSSALHLEHFFCIHSYSTNYRELFKFSIICNFSEYLSILSLRTVFSTFLNFLYQIQLCREVWLRMNSFV